MVPDNHAICKAASLTLAQEHPLADLELIRVDFTNTGDQPSAFKTIAVVIRWNKAHSVGQVL